MWAARTWVLADGGGVQYRGGGQGSCGLELEMEILEDPGAEMGDQSEGTPTRAHSSIKIKQRR